MSAIEAISYRARAGGSGPVIIQTHTSIRDLLKASRWQRKLEPWLQTGNSRGRAYLDFQPQAAFIRWQGSTESARPWSYAHVLVGPASELTGSYALELAELPELDGSGSALRGLPAVGKPGPRRETIEEQARSADAVAALIPLLAHALQGQRLVTMPWTAPGLPDAVMWGLISILQLIGDKRPVSFLTCSSFSFAPRPETDLPGLLVSFDERVAEPRPPERGFAAVASGLVHRFADDPAVLRQTLRAGLVPESPLLAGTPSSAKSPKSPKSPKPADDGDRVSRPGVPPRSQPEHVYREGAATVTANAGSPAPPADPVTSVRSAVMCPICLTDIPDWEALDYVRYGADGDYEKIVIPPDANPTQRARYQHGAYVRCPASQDDTMAVHHYLPAGYGRFGEPVLLGFVGLTESGKSHLLTSMIGSIGKLSDYQIDVEPLDPAMHQRFLESSVKPLITRNEVLPGTPDDATTEIADAFIVRPRNGPGRVVALFDVSGGVLAQTDPTAKTREFLWIADGLFFVIDPDHIAASKIGDDTFSNVLNIVRDRVKPEPVSAAIVLSKADKARFEEPVARWLRSGNGTMDPAEFLRESADVYSYLERRDAEVLIEPYRVCRKATLHVASSTGGAKDGEDKSSKYPRGVTPLRVLRPLVAMLAMTGVLTAPQAETIGV
jgi:hypothetical protein